MKRIRRIPLFAVPLIVTGFSRSSARGRLKAPTTRVHGASHGASHGGNSRRGTALVVAMICLLLVSMIGTLLVRMAVVQKQQVDRSGLRLQAEWLAESALDRAAARILLDDDYAGETWELAAEELPTGRAARVVIEVQPLPGKTAGNASRTVRVRAEYPRDETHRATVSREIVVDP